MKQGRRLKHWMKELLVKRNLEPAEWLAVKNLPGERQGSGELQVVHRENKDRVLTLTY